MPPRAMAKPAIKASADAKSQIVTGQTYPTNRGASDRPRTPASAGGEGGCKPRVRARALPTVGTFKIIGFCYDFRATVRGRPRLIAFSHSNFVGSTVGLRDVLPTVFQRCHVQ